MEQHNGAARWSSAMIAALWSSVVDQRNGAARLCDLAS